MQKRTLVLLSYYTIYCTLFDYLLLVPAEERFAASESHRRVVEIDRDGSAR